LTAELFRPEVLLTYFRAIILVLLELKACGINRTPKLDRPRSEYQSREVPAGSSSPLLVSSSLLPPCLLTAVLFPPSQTSAAGLSPGQPPFSPHFSNRWPFFQASRTSVCLLLPGPNPLPALGVQQWLGKCRFLGRDPLVLLPLWEGGVRPQASGNVCLRQGTESRSDYIRGVISSRTKGKAGWNGLAPQTCPVGPLL